MKKILYYILILSCLTFSACNKWLDVKPMSETKASESFKSEQGFKETLIGVYIKLAKEHLYGYHLTIGDIEYLANHWKTNPKSTESYLKNHEYTDNGVEAKMQSIYSNMYNVIANINSILDHIDAKKDVFSKGMYKLIKGEALALRAYCHFDILRLFGKVPSGAEDVNLPYAKTFIKEPHTFYAYDKFTQLIIKDFNEAEKCLKEVDPLNPIIKSKNKYTDSFFDKRKSRMNYYAVLALKARVYLWIQDKTNAYKYAKMMIEYAKIRDDKHKHLFRLGKSADLNSKDYLFEKEHIMRLHIFDGFDEITKEFSKEKSFTYRRTEKFLKEGVFNNNTKTDIRFRQLWKQIPVELGSYKKEYTIRKYDTNVKDETSGYIPLIRLYEMYLIAIETAPSLSESNKLFKEINDDRGVTNINLIDESKKLEEIIKEYRKEFYSEGQMFYTYKRLFVKNILGRSKKMKEKDYVVPIPVNN